MARPESSATSPIAPGIARSVSILIVSPLFSLLSSMPQPVHRQGCTPGAILTRFKPMIRGRASAPDTAAQTVGVVEGSERNLIWDSRAAGHYDPLVVPREFGLAADTVIGRFGRPSVTTAVLHPCEARIASNV